MYKCKWLPLRVAVLGGSETFIRGDNGKSCHWGCGLKGALGLQPFLPSLLCL